MNFFMLKDVLQRISPALYANIRATALRHGISIETLSDEELMSFIESKMGTHIADLVKRLLETAQCN